MQVDGVGAVVFGGASGLGEATARRLAHAGAKVVVADLAEDKGNALAGEIGGVFVRVDVTNEAEVQAAVDAGADAGDSLRIAVNCAGIGPPEKIVDREGNPAPQASYEKIIGVNLLGTIQGMRIAAARMSANEADDDHQRGVIVNTASAAAFDGQIGQTAYSASKGGVVGITLPAARDLSKAGIRVMCIAPGLFDTPLLSSLPKEAYDALGKQVPNPSRLGAPDEFAQLVEQIVVNNMLNGEVIRLDGAIRMAPR